MTGGCPVRGQGGLSFPRCSIAISGGTGREVCSTGSQNPRPRPAAWERAASSESCLRVLPLPGAGAVASAVSPRAAGTGCPGCPGPESQRGGRLAQAWSVGRGAAHLVSQHRMDRLLFPNGSFAHGLGESTCHSPYTPQRTRSRSCLRAARLRPHVLAQVPPLQASVSPFYKSADCPPTPYTLASPSLTARPPAGWTWPRTPVMGHLPGGLFPGPDPFPHPKRASNTPLAALPGPAGTAAPSPETGGQRRECQRRFPLCGDTEGPAWPHTALTEPVLRIHQSWGQAGGRKGATGDGCRGGGEARAWGTHGAGLPTSRDLGLGLRVSLVYNLVWESDEERGLPRALFQNVAIGPGGEARTDHRRPGSRRLPRPSAPPSPVPSRRQWLVYYSSIRQEDRSHCYSVRSGLWGRRKNTHNRIQSDTAATINTQRDRNASEPDGLESVLFGRVVRCFGNSEM